MILKLLIVCFFIGFCVSALIFVPVFYERGLKASCSCAGNHNFTFIQDKEVFYEGQYNFTGLGEE